jgi:hypothetical protein
VDDERDREGLLESLTFIRAPILLRLSRVMVRRGMPDQWSRQAMGWRLSNWFNAGSKQEHLWFPCSPS